MDDWLRSRLSAAGAHCCGVNSIPRPVHTRRPAHCRARLDCVLRLRERYAWQHAEGAHGAAVGTRRWLLPVDRPRRCCSSWRALC